MFYLKQYAKCATLAVAQAHRPLWVSLFSVPLFVVFAFLSGCGSGHHNNNGSSNPTPSASASPTPTPVATPSATPFATPSPNATPVPATSGNAVFTIDWLGSSDTRLIPKATTHVRVDILSADGTRVITSGRADRSMTPSTITFPNLPTGNLTANAYAFAGADDAMPALASGTTPLAIVSGRDTPFTITMASTIDHLTASTTDATTLLAGSTAKIMATAFNKEGAMILLSSDQLQWVPSTGGVVTSDTTSLMFATLITAKLPGKATITVTDKESGKSASVDFTVPITITPTNPTVSIGNTITFTANFGAFWSIRENGSNASGPGGTIVADKGIYSAPSTKGTYHIIATNGSITGETTVTVQAGSATGTIQ